MVEGMRLKKSSIGVRSSDFVRTGVGGSHRKTAHPSGRRRLEPAAVPRCRGAGWRFFRGLWTKLSFLESILLSDLWDPWRSKGGGVRVG